MKSEGKYSLSLYDNHHPTESVEDKWDTHSLSICGGLGLLYSGCRSIISTDDYRTPSSCTVWNVPVCPQREFSSHLLVQTSSIGNLLILPSHEGQEHLTTLSEQTKPSVCLLFWTMSSYLSLTRTRGSIPTTRQILWTRYPPLEHQSGNLWTK